MNRTKSILGLVAVGAFAFIIGRAGVDQSQTAIASPQDHSKDHGKKHADHNEHAGEMDADMMKMMAAGMPGENHKHLNALDGNWEGNFTMWMERGGEPMTTSGTIEREWVLDGRYLREVVEATADFGTFQGLGYVGFNNLSGQYEMVWMENMSTSIMFATGSYNAKTKILTTQGDFRDPVSGHMISMRSELDMSYPNRHSYKSWSTGADGVEYLSFDGVMERIK